MPETATDRLIRELGKKADAAGIGALTEEEKNVLVPWFARGEIGNGGFRYFLEGTHLLGDLVPRFRALGLEKAAAACEQVLAQLFPAGEPADRGARARMLAAADWKRFRPQEAVVWALAWEDLERAVQVYVSRHPAAFPP